MSIAPSLPIVFGGIVAVVRVPSAAVPPMLSVPKDSDFSSGFSSGRTGTWPPGSAWNPNTTCGPSSAARDLYRGHSVALPSGEAIARSLGRTPCTATELKTTDADWSETPLWLYVLAEAEAQH